MNPTQTSLRAALQQMSVAAAGVVSGLFFMFVPLGVLNLLWTSFTVYLMLTFSCLARSLSYALRAAFTQEWNVGAVVAAYVFDMIGLGLITGSHTTTITCWYKNADNYARPHPKFSQMISKFGQCLLPCTFIFGPILGSIGAGLKYGATSGAYTTAVTKTSSIGLLCIIGIATLMTIGAVISALIGVPRQRRSGMQDQDKSDAQGSRGTMRDGNLMIIFLLPACLLISTSLAARVANDFGHKNIEHSNDILYLVVVLPELLDLCILLWPTLLARMGLATNYDQHVQSSKQKKQQKKQGRQEQEQDDEEGQQQQGHQQSHKQQRRRQQGQFMSG